VGEEVESNSVVARFGDQRPRVQDFLVEVPPVEERIVLPRFVKRYAEVIDNRVDYLLGDSHRGPENADRASPSLASSPRADRASQSHVISCGYDNGRNNKKIIHWDDYKKKRRPSDANVL
jgi:hypothetical protein